MTLNWKISDEDARHLNRIADCLPNLDRLNLEMDLTATHANGNPLDLEAMALEAEAGRWTDLLHDINGIRRHIDRNTGALLDCFVPRFSRKD